MSELTLFPPAGEDAPRASPFDLIREIRPDGSEFWWGRDLMTRLGYTNWRNFSAVIERARDACARDGMDVTRLFDNTIKKSDGRPAADFQLSRFACYRVAQAADPWKPEVSAAHTYFAVRTRQAETAPPPGPSSVLEARSQGFSARDIALLVIEQADRAERAEQRVAELEPAAEAHAAFEAAEGEYSMGEAAKMVGTGQNRLFSVLRARGVLITGGRLNNTPYQPYLDRGLFRVRRETWTDVDGVDHLSRTTMVRAPGLDFLRRLLAE